MVRVLVVMVCVLGWVILAGGIIAPLGGIIVAATDTGRISTEIVAVPPPLALFVRSITLSAVATAAALLLGIPAAAVLAGLGYSAAARTRRARATSAIVWGLVLAPLLVPPQVYAYAWGLATAPNRILGTIAAPLSGAHWLGGAVRAGLISAGWLWPVVAMIVAAGWRMTGRAVLTLAVLDASPTRAFFRAVLPTLRPHLVAAGCLVFAITLLEYPIPHLSLVRVYATELMVLTDVHAPPGQVMRMAAPMVATVLVVLAIAAWSLRDVSRWGSADDNDPITRLPGRASNHWLTVSAAGLVWLATLGLPAAVMVRSLRSPGQWTQGFELFGREWVTSLAVSAAAGVAAIALAAGTILLWLSTGSPHGRRKFWPRLGRIGAVLAMIGGLVPAAALGVGLIIVFNRAGPLGYLYTDTAVVWVLALAARYGAVVVLIVWLALRRRASSVAEQAEIDGAGPLDIATWILLPAVWPALLAGGVLVMVLSMFEVVVSQLIRPVGFPSIALALLNQMHYGRDDVVITTSLLIVAAGIVVTQVCAWLLTRPHGVTS